MPRLPGQPEITITVGVPAVTEMIALARPAANPDATTENFANGAMLAIVQMLIGDTPGRPSPRAYTGMDHTIGAHIAMIQNVMDKFSDNEEAAEIILDEIQADRRHGVERPAGRGNIYWARDGDTYVMFGR